MKVVWEVKCYHCSRVCGLLLGAPKPIDLLADSSNVRKALRCSVLEKEQPRCSRCGGQLYTEKADGFYPIETLNYSSLN